ncbi:MAG TPA: GNAT family N-acetyltransferase [Acidimicrobiales bacterium]
MLRPEYPIRTERLDLRPFVPEDHADVLAFRSRADVARYLLTGRLGPDEVRELLRKAAGRTALRREGDELALAVVERATGRVIGDVVLVWRSADHMTGEIGYVFHPEVQGRGYATEAAQAVLALGFDQLGLHRIIGRCDARNTASARVLERLGMRQEAHFVENERIKGEWTDELVYALLAREWRKMNQPPA